MQGKDIVRDVHEAVSELLRGNNKPIRSFADMWGKSPEDREVRRVVLELLLNHQVEVLEQTQMEFHHKKSKKAHNYNKLYSYTDHLWYIAFNEYQYKWAVGKNISFRFDADGVFIGFDTPHAMFSELNHVVDYIVSATLGNFISVEPEVHFDPVSSNFEFRHSVTMNRKRFMHSVPFRTGTEGNNALITLLSRLTSSHGIGNEDISAAESVNFCKSMIDIETSVKSLNHIT